MLLASGTGFAPIKAIIEQMREKGSTRPASLYWGGRRPADLYQADWIAEQCAAMPNLKYVPVVSDALPGDGWSGRTGFVHEAVLQDFPTCRAIRSTPAAPIVVESAQRDYVARANLPADEFYADAFTSEKDKHGA